MSTFGPLDHYPGILERVVNLIDLQVQMRDRPEVDAVVLWASHRIEHLYGDRTGAGLGGDNDQRMVLLSAANKPSTTIRRPIATSDSMLRRGLRYDEVTRGVVRFLFDLNDFNPIFDNGAGKTVKVLPSDDQPLFVAIQQVRPSLPVSGNGIRENVVKGAVDTGDPILGPILVIPTAHQMKMAETSIVIASIAPVNSAAMGGAGEVPTPDLDLQVVNPLHLVMPRPTTSFTIRNTDAAESLLVSHGLGAQIYEVPAGEFRTFFGAVKDICLQSATANACSFSLEANCNFGGAAGGV